MSPIVQVGTPVLRETAAPVPVADITSKRIQDIIADMQKTLAAEPDGAALAAPQIGVGLRIFVIAQRVFCPGKDDEPTPHHKDTHLVYINPAIIKRSRRKRVVDEGCLSVRGKYGTITRATNVTIEAYDEHGDTFTRGAGGLLAQAFQHETDHLDGTLFIDTAQELWKVEVPKSNNT